MRKSRLTESQTASSLKQGEVAGLRYAPLGAPFCGVLKPGETH